MSKSSKFLRAALRMGARPALYRALWEVDRRSGFKRQRTPIGRVPLPRETVQHADWLGGLSDEHWLSTVRRETAGKNPALDVCEAAQAALEGRFRLFGKTVEDFGSPPRWHLEPSVDREWPLLHWTDAVDAPVGDLRTTWEANRFGHVWAWVLAADDERQARYARAFEEQVVHWIEENPFRAGVNWASGQELAVRSLNWLTGLAVFGDLLSPESFRSVQHALYWHAFHIDAELGFARHAVPNNHLLAETFALAALADAFPNFAESEQWRGRGLELLDQAAREQFDGDGGYCQASHSYERFALELLLWADVWFGELDFRAVFQRALHLFEQLVESQGRVPNFGPNDGARALAAYGCGDARDYRPLIALLRDRLGQSVTNDGGGVEAVRQLTGKVPQRVDGDFEPSCASFREAGIHVVRDDQWTAVLRCGSLPSRGGHSDALHVDVARHGTWVAVDPGSARYMGDRHSAFVSAAAHNTVLVDGTEPRALLGRFTWEDGADPELREFDGERRLVAARYVPHPDFVWDRTVHIIDGAVRVRDRISPVGEVGTAHVFELRWLLSTPVRATSRDDIGRRFRAVLEDTEVIVRVDPIGGSLRGLATEVESRGVAWYYGHTSEAAGLRVAATGRGVTFETQFTSR